MAQLGPVLHIEEVDPESLVNCGQMPDIGATEHTRRRRSERATPEASR